MEENTEVATRDDVVSMLKTIIDPELYIDIYTLGLIYDISVEAPELQIKMTFTSMACPAGPQLVDELLPVLRRQMLRSSLPLRGSPPKTSRHYWG